MNNQQVMDRTSELQSKLSRREIVVNAPCGNETFIGILGGINARAAINEGRDTDKYPNVEKELENVEELIELMQEE